MRALQVRSTLFVVLSQWSWACIAAVPRQYQPDIILLLPKLLDPADHATAANLLIAHLAEATRLGPAAEALIRLPVLATLGLLTVDAGTAKKLLTAVLNVSRKVVDSSAPYTVYFT